MTQSSLVLLHDDGTHLAPPGAPAKRRFVLPPARVVRNKVPATRFGLLASRRCRAKPQDNTEDNQGEGPMPVQWTAHIPQAMQRHGGSIKPEVEAACDEAMDRFLRGLRQAEPRQPDSRTDEPR